MQTKNPFFDDLAQLMTNAMGAAQGVSEEMQALFRAQAERFVAEMDLVGRDEFEVLKDENAALRARLEALEAAAGGAPVAEAAPTPAPQTQPPQTSHHAAQSAMPPVSPEDGG